MPLIDEFFATTNIKVVQNERNLEAGVLAHVEVQFEGGQSGMPGVNGQPDPLYIKRTKLDPQAALRIGEALVEAGKALSGLDLAVVGDMSAAVAEAEAQDRLRNGTNPSQD